MEIERETTERMASIVPGGGRGERINGKGEGRGRKRGAAARVAARNENLSARIGRSRIAATKSFRRGSVVERENAFFPRAVTDWSTLEAAHPGKVDIGQLTPRQTNPCALPLARGGAS